MSNYPSHHPAGLTVLEDPRGLVVRIHTDIRVQNAAEVLDSVLDVWKSKGKPWKLVVDLTDAHYIDSAGVGTLMSIAQNGKAADSLFVFCGLDEAFRRVLNRTGLAKLLQISGSVDEALGGSTVSGTGAGFDTAALAVPLRQGRRRYRDEEESGHRHRHRGLWFTMTLLTVILIAGAVYVYWAVETYRGRLDLVPAIQGQLAAAGQRIDAAETALTGWSAQRDAWERRLKRAEATVRGTLGVARKQAENIAARAERQMQAALDQRTGALAARVDGIQAAQQSADARIAALQVQLDQLKSSGRQDTTGADGQLHQPALGTPGRERVDFELGVDRDRQLVPGISLDISHTDVRHRRFSGRVRVMPDGRALWIHDQGLHRPFVFYTGSDARPRELVITRVTRSAVVGYLLVPVDAHHHAPVIAAKSFPTPASDFSLISRRQPT